MKRGLMRAVDDQSLPRSLDPKRKVLHPLSTAAVITCRFSVHTQTVFLSSAGAAAEARILTEARRSSEADAATTVLWGVSGARREAWRHDRALAEAEEEETAIDD